jgi:sodium/hydrogen exchanger-like protein 6/7
VQFYHQPIPYRFYPVRYFFNDIVFSQLKVEETLYNLIFGESILNDSVAIVLFHVLAKFKGTTLSFNSFMTAVLMFFGAFTGSIGVGVAIALLCALLLKYSQLYRFHSLESCIILLIAYSSYVFSNAIELSGIVSLLFWYIYIYPF